MDNLGAFFKMATADLAALDAEIDHLLGEYRKSFSPHGRSTGKEFEERFGVPLWKKGKWSQVLKAKASELSLRDKLTLVAASRMPTPNSAFEYVRLNVHGAVGFPLKHDFDGCYRYWRFFRKGRRLGLRWGLVKVSTTANDYTSTEHWSFDALEDLEQKHAGDIHAIARTARQPEDAGFALYTQRKLFMLGFRRQNMRLAIADLPARLEQLPTQPLRGIVLTNRGDAELYAAAFVMFHDTNPDFEKPLTETKFAKYVDEFRAHESQRVISK